MKKFLEKGSTKGKKESILLSFKEEQVGGAYMFKRKIEFFREMLIPMSSSKKREKR